MDNKEELWLPVQGYEGMYEVSSLGRVKSLKRNKAIILRLSPDGRGYYICVLFKNGFRKTTTVHRLVAIAFLNKGIGKSELVIDHINGDKFDNAVDNLRLVTSRDNVTICYRKDAGILTSKYAGVHLHTIGGKWLSHIVFNGKQRHLGLFSVEEDAAVAYQEALGHILIGDFDRYLKSIKRTTKGYYFDKNRGLWAAEITIMGKKKHLGRFAIEEAASIAYQAALKMVS